MKARIEIWNEKGMAIATRVVEDEDDVKVCEATSDAVDGLPTGWKVVVVNIDKSE